MFTLTVQPIIYMYEMLLNKVMLAECVYKETQNVQHQERCFPIQMCEINHNTTSSMESRDS